MNGKSNSSVIVSADGPDVVVENVTLQTPDYRRTLIEDLSLKIGPGADLVIVGSSGGGKSSLLRAIGGLWTSGTGRIIRPHSAELLFLPQKPYMILGTLRDQMLYPKMHEDTSDEELRELLKAVNLGELPDRFEGFDVEMDWGRVLSLGEQQRLAFARLLLAKPRFAMLDEASSALDMSNESIVYQRLKETGTILVSISHRSSILQYHHHVLQLTGNAKWQIHSVKDFQFEGE